MIIGKFIPTSNRDEFIDFSIPHYDDGGITLLMKRPVTVYSLLLFVEVFSNEVWLCIILTLTGTAMLTYAFERIRVHLFKDEIQYSLSDCIWIIIGSFTLSGGIVPPKAKSICILIASFWFFSAIIICTYQANLAAFITLQTKLGSIKDLLQETELEYSAVGKFLSSI